MQALPSAFSCQVSRPWWRVPPRGWTAKSMIVVVPPKAAARVPDSNVSLANVPPNGSSMWVWGSIPPGMTYLPVASMTRSAGTSRSRPMRAISSSSTRTSAETIASALTIVPPLMSVRMCSSSGTRMSDRAGGSGAALGANLRMDEVGVHLRPAVAVELPRLADFLDHVHVEVADDQLFVMGVAHGS